MNPIDTGRFIREQRKKLNLSQSKLAEMLCVEPQTVSKWERGLGMPDYDNVNRLKEIFGCTLSEILEPSFDDELENTDTEKAEPTEESTVTNLPVLVEIIEDKEEKSDKKTFGIFDFLNKKKIKAILEKMFGYEYANTYNEKFLTKNVFKKRTREECETTLTQGMFRSKMNHPVIGIEAPWLYMRLFFFMLLCSGIAFGLALLVSPMPFVIIGGLFSVLPLMMFLFESNFARNLSIVDVGKMFVIGGMCSIIVTFIISFSSDSEVLSAVVIAPLFEEISKAIMVVYFVSKMKPTNMLTGLLIGFSVGAGFTFFENMNYAFNIAILGADSGDLLIAFGGPVINIIVRTLGDFFMGHHYWTAVFGGVYVLFKKKTEFDIEELLTWRVMLALLFSICLHAMWNGSGFIDVNFIPFVMRVIVCAVSVTSLIVLINVGIAQTRILGIWEDYRSEHKEDSVREEQKIS